MNRADNFNRADTTSNLGTPSDGGSDWVQGSGTWGISSNKAYASAASGVVRAYLEASTANVDMSVTFSTFVANGMAVIFRYANEGDNWVVINDGSAWKLILRLGGNNQSPDANQYAVAGANGDVVRVVANGSGSGAIQVYINGTLRITSSQFETFLATETKHGFNVNSNTTARFDDFSITDLDAPSGGTTYTLVAPTPARGLVGVASGNFTVTPDGDITAEITPDDNGDGGTFTPTSLTWSGTDEAQTFTYTPASAGTKTIAATNDGGLTDADSVDYEAIDITTLRNVVAVGTSLTAGFGSQKTWMESLFGVGQDVYGGSGTTESGPILTNASGWYNGGNTAVTGTRIDQFESNSGAAIVAAYNEDAIANILVVEGGTNDFNNGDSAATTLQRMKDFVGPYRSDGWKIVILTVTPADLLTGGFNAVRNTYNALLRADHSWYDGLVDPAADGRFGQDGQEANTTPSPTNTVTWYQGDHIHWSRVAADQVAGLVAAKLYDLANGDRIASGGGSGGYSRGRIVNAGGV